MKTFKRIVIWVPLLGVLILPFIQKDDDASMYEEYFDYGSPFLIVVSLIWQSISSIYVIGEILNLWQ